MTKTERSDEPEIYHVKSDDKEMNDAISKARNSLSDFLSAYQLKNSNFSKFFIKVAFENSKDIEHIWVKVISTDNKNIQGIINNLPHNTTTIVLGDTINIHAEQISDWMYFDTINNKIFGAQTIRVVRNRMTSDEQVQLDNELGGTLK
jgi:uncharacterized protein YegJ (DUF2314 family)